MLHYSYVHGKNIIYRIKKGEGGCTKDRVNTSDKAYDNQFIMTTVTLRVAYGMHSKETLLSQYIHIPNPLSPRGINIITVTAHMSAHTPACEQTHLRTHNHKTSDYLQICGWSTTGGEKSEIGRFEEMGFESSFKGWRRLRVMDFVINELLWVRPAKEK